jgi:hypothetical protein
LNRLMNDRPQHQCQHSGPRKRADCLAGVASAGRYFQPPEQIGRHSSEQAEHEDMMFGVRIVLRLPHIGFNFSAPSISNLRRECERV